MSQRGTKPYFELEELKCYVAMEEVALTLPFVSFSVACSSSCMRSNMQATDFLMGAVFSLIKIKNEILV